MTKVKDIINAKDSHSSNWSVWFRHFQRSFMSKLNIGVATGKSIYTVARYVGWFVVTVGMITVLPLVMEIKRESILEELESAQIAEALSEGRTPQELVHNGLTSAVAPSVF